MIMQDINKEIEFFNNLTLDVMHSFPHCITNTFFNELNKLNINIEGVVLEGGCGVASFGKILLKYFPKANIIGVDINQKFVQYIESDKLSRYKAICGNLEDRNLFKANTFDFIVFPYVLHHFPDIRKVIENSYYWLKENGMVFIIDPNGSNLILRTSYIIRKFLNSVFPKFIFKYGSINEKHIPQNTYLAVLKRSNFSIVISKSFLNQFDINIIHKFNFIEILATARFLMLKLFFNGPFAKNVGSDLIIIAAKLS